MILSPQPLNSLLQARTKTSLRSPLERITSFWRETVIVVVTMSFSKCRGGGNKLSNVRGFSILCPGKALTFFNKGNCTNYFYG